MGVISLVGNEKVKTLGGGSHPSLNNVMILLKKLFTKYHSNKKSKYDKVDNELIISGYFNHSKSSFGLIHIFCFPFYKLAIEL